MKKIINASYNLKMVWWKETKFTYMVWSSGRS